jgi:hypothetical protein
MNKYWKTVSKLLWTTDTKTIKWPKSDIVLKFIKHLAIHIVARMWRLYKTGIGLTTGFIRSHTVTHNYSVLHFTAHNN